VDAASQMRLPWWSTQRPALSRSLARALRLGTSRACATRAGSNHEHRVDTGPVVNETRRTPAQARGLMAPDRRQRSSSTYRPTTVHLTAIRTGPHPFGVNSGAAARPGPTARRCGRPGAGVSSPPTHYPLWSMTDQLFGPARKIVTNPLADTPERAAENDRLGPPAQLPGRRRVSAKDGAQPRSQTTIRAPSEQAGSRLLSGPTLVARRIARTDAQESHSRSSRATFKTSNAGTIYV